MHIIMYFEAATGIKQ